jgi:hypothetical protein
MLSDIAKQLLLLAFLNLRLKTRSSFKPVTPQRQIPLKKMRGALSWVLPSKLARDLAMIGGIFLLA